MMRAASDEFGGETALDVPSRQAVLFNGLALGAVTLATILPSGAVLYWLTIAPDEARLLTGLSLDVLPDITMVQRLAAAALGLLTVLPIAWGLVRLRSCFTSFAAGRPFAARGISGLRDFALGGMLAALAQLINHTLTGLVLTWTAMQGHRQLVVRIDSDMLLLAMFAGTIATLVWALEKAAAIAQENSQFI